MNLTQLRAFHAVALKGSFTQAADYLCISQPAVTASITALEERHGIPLFHRQGRKISLSPAGEHLFEIAGKLFTLEEEAEEYLTETQDLKTGKLRLAVGSPFGIAAAIRKFREKYPGIEIQLMPGNFKNVEDMLLTEKADIAIQTEASEIDGIIRHPFQEHHLIAFFHEDNPMASNNGSINLWQLEEAPLILRETGSITRQIFDDLCRENHVQPKNFIEAGSREAVHELVREGLGIGIVLSGEMHKDTFVTHRNLAEAPEPIWDYLLYLDRRGNLKLIQEFLLSIH